MQPIDDYELIDQDFDEFIRRGREAFEWEAQHEQGETEEVA
ncbi:hypothetical protein [Paenibacillus spongiae]|nr:hypothetical protein [Paenibacillus spongiae]